MSERLVLNADEASKAIRNITEQVEVIGAAAAAFRGTVEGAFEKSDLTFLDTIAKAMGKIESNVRSLTENCAEIQQALSRYVGQFADYSEDTTGLQ
jgi:phage-related protein